MSTLRRCLRSLPVLALAAGAACHAVAPPGARSSAAAPATLPFRDPDLPLEARVADLVGRLTLEEKVGQLMNTAPAIPRLGIPAYDWWSEGLHGVARAGVATVFPQAIGLAATWDTGLMHQVATVISTEARAKHHEAVREGRRDIYEGLTFWSPNINIFRDPRWGRGMETYGEDPFLTGRLAVAFVRGMQGDDPRYLRVVATPKHFAVHSGPEPGRHGFDAVVDPRDIEETYLPAFDAAVAEGGAQSVMCAYNRLDGIPACANPFLLRQTLRQRWGFRGYVVSDCDAVDDIRTGHKVTADSAEAAAMALKAGDDLNCGRTHRMLVDAVRRGLVTEAQVDTAVGRLFRARFRLGMFDPPERVPYAAIPYGENDSPAHRALALEAARKSIVLLRNDGGLLPLGRDLRRIAVIGPNAADVEVLLGNYNGLPAEPVTPLAGIRAKVAPATEVVYARGSEVAPSTPSLEVVPSSALVTDTGAARTPGLRGWYFANHDWLGSPAAERADTALSFFWERSPAPGIPADSFSIRWRGAIVPPVTGRYALGVEALGVVKLYLDDSLIVQFSERHEVVAAWANLDLVAGQARRIRVEYADRRPDAVVRLVWSAPDAQLLDSAVAAARRADVAVLCLGLSPRLEGEELPVRVPGFEGGDRTSLDLPAPQEALLEAVVATGKPVVLVLLNGSALGIDWAAEHVPAIVEAWYPGQAAGQAIADVLFGDYNPAGRLPVTSYRSVDQLPVFTDYRMAGRTYRFFRGDALYSFGYGLSYTRFRYRDLRVPSTVRAGDSSEVSVEVENAGRVAGEEVVELYLSALDGDARSPIRSLEGFQRVSLRPGERRRVVLALAPRQLSTVDSAGVRAVVPGRYEVSVGGRQPGASAVADAAALEVLRARFDIVGARYPVP
jgi:beta-glucosidase